MTKWEATVTGGQIAIPFNVPFVVGREQKYIAEAIASGHLSGDGKFSHACHKLLEDAIGAQKALLTPSCSHALDMTAILADIQDGDEVIMPSYTFTSTANAFVARGGVPVFVDIREDTLNLDETLIEAAITPKTKAIVPVHYAGVACEMDSICAIGRQHQLLVIEDAAQGFMSFYHDRPLGAIGDMGTLSFHATKNIVCGEGGALVLRDAQYISRAEMVREKGTNRRAFMRGDVDKYTWCDQGSSYLLGEILAAFLYAQLEEAHEITERRVSIWNRYHEAFSALETIGHIRRPIVPSHCLHNGHIYYLLLENEQTRTPFIDHLRKSNISSAFHYVPLHLSPMGECVSRTDAPLEVTNKAAQTLVRLPLYSALSEELQDIVIDCVFAFFQK